MLWSILGWYLAISFTASVLFGFWAWIRSIDVKLWDE